MKETFELPSESIEGYTHTAHINGKVYDVYKLIEWAKTIEPNVVPTSQFENNKEGKFWDAEDGSRIGPADIMNVLEENQDEIDWDGFIKKYPEWREHIESIRDADYDAYPIMYTGEGLIIDGMHRLTKAWMNKAKEI